MFLKTRLNRSDQPFKQVTG